MLSSSHALSKSWPVTAWDCMAIYPCPEASRQRICPRCYWYGGPWARDDWGYHSTTQILANRGYAVMRINYRGSSGYGRDFMNAAIGEFAGKMHTDLIDAVDWAIEEGIADPL